MIQTHLPMDAAREWANLFFQIVGAVCAAIALYYQIKQFRQTALAAIDAPRNALSAWTPLQLAPSFF